MLRGWLSLLVLVFAPLGVTAPGSAVAQGGWSAVAPVGSLAGDPALWIGSDARSRVLVSSDGLAWMSFGDDANRFSPPKSVFPVPRMLVDAVPAGDGSALVSLFNGSALSALGLSGDGVMGVPQTLSTGGGIAEGFGQVGNSSRGVAEYSSAVTADGGRVAVWRLSTPAIGDAPRTYQVQVAIAPPGAPFGQPVTLEDSSGQVMWVAAAAGRDGTVAVGWTHRYDAAQRMRVAVRAPGSPDFGPAETISGRVGKDVRGYGDYGIGLLVGDGGAVTAAWGNDGGVFTRQRTGGEFGAPQTLTTDSRVDPEVLLGPAGALAATWTPRSGTTDPAVRVAIRPGGGSVTTTDVAPRPSGYNAAQPKLAFDRAGTGYLVWQRAGGGILAATRTPSGVWSAPALISPANIGAPHVAAGPAGHAVLAWAGTTVDDPNTTYAATYEEASTGAPGGGSQTTPPKDTRAPHTTLLTKSLRLTSPLKVRLRCNEACSITARGAVTSRNRVTTLRTITQGRLARAHTLSFRIPRTTLRKYRALPTGAAINLRLDLRLTDRAGNHIAEHITATLKH